jgi:hypothetical protein
LPARRRRRAAKAAHPRAAAESLHGRPRIAGLTAAEQAHNGAPHGRAAAGSTEEAAHDLIQQAHVISPLVEDAFGPSGCSTLASIFCKLARHRLVQGDVLLRRSALACTHMKLLRELLADRQAGIEIQQLEQINDGSSASCLRRPSARPFACTADTSTGCCPDDSALWLALDAMEVAAPAGAAG